MANEKIKVVLAKTTKINKKFVQAGEEIEISESQKNNLVKKGIITDGKPVVNADLTKANVDLVKKVEELEKANKTLESEKEDLVKKVEELEKAGQSADLLGDKK